MIIDGRALAKTIYDAVATEIAVRPRAPKLVIITCAPQAATKQYLELKRRKAKAVGLPLSIIELPYEATTAEVLATIATILPHGDGMVVQLPLPPHIDREAVLAAVPVTHDPDGFSYGHHPDAVLPPVVAAIDYISTEYAVAWAGANVAIVGHGRLVGQPAAQYASARGAVPHIVTESTRDATAILANADIVVSGVGKPHFITKAQVKAGVVIFDAGASEDGGVVVGDVHPEVAETAALFTPVPGGIGPITVAALLHNLVTLTR